MICDIVDVIGCRQAPPLKGQGHRDAVFKWSAFSRSPVCVRKSELRSADTSTLTSVLTTRKDVGKFANSRHCGSDGNLPCISGSFSSVTNGTRTLLQETNPDVSNPSSTTAYESSHGDEINAMATTFVTMETARFPVTTNKTVPTRETVPTSITGFRKKTHAGVARQREQKREFRFLNERRQDFLGDRYDGRYGDSLSDLRDNRLDRWSDYREQRNEERQDRLEARRDWYADGNERVRDRNENRYEYFADRQENGRRWGNRNGYFADRPDNRNDYLSERRENRNEYYADRLENRNNVYADQRENRNDYYADRTENRNEYFADQRNNRNDYSADRRENRNDFFADQRDNRNDYLADRRENGNDYFADQRDNRNDYSVDRRGYGVDFYGGRPQNRNRYFGDSLGQRQTGRSDFNAENWGFGNGKNFGGRQAVGSDYNAQRWGFNSRNDNNDDIRDNRNGYDERPERAEFNEARPSQRAQYFGRGRELNDQGYYEMNS